MQHVPLRVNRHVQTHPFDLPRPGRKAAVALVAAPPRGGHQPAALNAHQPAALNAHALRRLQVQPTRAAVAEAGIDDPHPGQSHAKPPPRPGLPRMTAVDAVTCLLARSVWLPPPTCLLARSVWLPPPIPLATVSTTMFIDLHVTRSLR